MTKKNFHLSIWFLLFICISGVSYIYISIAGNQYLHLILFFLLLFAGHLFVLCEISLKIGGGSRRNFDLFSPYVIFPIGYSLIYGLGALQLSEDEKVIDPLQFKLYFVGLGAYYIGLIFIDFLSKRQKISPKFNQISDIDYGKLRIISSALFVVSILAFFYVTYKANLPIFQADVENARTQLSIQVGAGPIFIIRSIAVSVMFMLWVFIQRRGLEKDSLILIIFSMIGLFVISCLGYRGRVYHVILVAVICFHYMKRNIQLIHIALGTLVFAIVHSILGVFRKVGSSEFGGIDIAERFFREIQIPSANFQLITENVPYVLPYFKGLVLLLPFSALLPGQQLALGLVLKESLGLEFSGGGFVPSLLGGFYLDFGVFSVFLGMLFLGILLGKAYTFMLSKKTIFSLLLYSNLVVYSLNSIRGMFLQDIFIIWLIVLLVVMSGYIQKNRRRIVVTPVCQ